MFIRKEDEEDHPSFDIFREADNGHQNLTPEVFIQGTNVLTTIEEFRNSLIKELEPFGDIKSGFEINKTHDEVHEILINLKLYRYGTSFNDQTREYAKFYYKNLQKKSAEE
jgi:hypothetical protein